MDAPLGLDDPLIPARNLTHLLDNLERRCGIRPEQVLPGTGIDPQVLRSERARITPRQDLAVLRNARRHGMPDDFGLCLADDFDISQFGLLGYAMMSAATLSSSIDIALRYYKTAGPRLALEFTVADGRAELIAYDAFGLGELLPFAVDSLFATLPRLLTLLTGEPIFPVSVDLEFGPPRYAAHYLDRYGLEPRYRMPECRFGIDPAVLELPLVRADAASAHLFEQSCRELLEAMEDDQSTVGRLRRLLLESPGRIPNAEDAAAHLGIGARTLRRRLRAEGSTYQQVVDDVRRRMASDYLSRTDLPIQQVAELLGYTEATNFRRAFIRWTGQSPRRYRDGAAIAP